MSFAIRCGGAGTCRVAVSRGFCCADGQVNVVRLSWVLLRFANADHALARPLPLPRPYRDDDAQGAITRLKRAPGDTM